MDILFFHFTVGKLHGWRIFANSPFKNGRKPASVNQSDEKQVYGRTGFIWFHKFQQWSPCINGHASIKWQSHTRFNPGKLLKKVMTGFSFSEYPRTSEANGWNSSKWTGHLVVLAKTFIIMKNSSQSFWKIFSNGWFDGLRRL